MIINTGQRTDIPAFYSTWFMNRIREGYVLVRNPYVPHLVTRYRLDPKVVDCLGFATKNPHPLIPYLDELSPFGQFWYITITGLGKYYEPNVPPKEQVIEDFKVIAEKIGKKAMGWRYTPIIVDEEHTLDHHIATFESIASALEGYTSLVAFGFLDLYPKLRRLHPELADCKDEEKIALSRAFREIAAKHGMEARLCSKEKWLSEYGIDVNGCMRIEDYERAIGSSLSIKKKGDSRKGYCACYLSNDIGAYDSCPHLCRYCYANGERGTVLANIRLHDPSSPLLIGGVEEGDTIVEAKQESNIRLSLLDDFS